MNEQESKTTPSSGPHMPPPLLLAGGLLVWGWLAGLLLEASILALFLEARWITSLRFRLKDADWHRATDLCFVLFAGAVLYVFFTPQPQNTLIVLAKWMPLCMAPLALVQAYSQEDRARLRHIFYFLKPRRQRKKAKKPKSGQTRGKPPAAANLLFPYFGVCLLAAGCANERAPWYFGLLFLLTLPALYRFKPARHGLGPWLGLALLAGGVAYGGQYLLYEVQMYVRGWAKNYTQDPYKSSTSIGEIVEIKLSSKIVLRVRPDFYEPGKTLLLRESSYDYYLDTEWGATNAGFTPIEHAENDETAWMLNPNAAPDSFATIYEFFPRKDGLVYLPAGAVNLEQLPTEELSLNRLGAVKVKNPAGLVSYRVWYGDFQSLEGPPTAPDLFCPKQEADAVQRVLDEIGIDGMTPEQIVEAVKLHLQTEYDYSLNLKYEQRPNHEGLTALGRFLLLGKEGHCEYFATAAALLLRRAGIPSRYATGWSVQEYDGDAGFYLVRQSHAHAWARAWLGDRWVDVDATPVIWSVADQRPDSLAKRFADFRSRAVFWVSRFRWLEEGKAVRQTLLWLTIPFGLYLLYRVRRKSGMRRVRKEKGPVKPVPRQGHDSEFMDIVNRLVQTHGPRPESESLANWLRRLKLDPHLIGQALDLHYRLRFDPKGLVPAEREKLAVLVKQWLNLHEARNQD